MKRLILLALTALGFIACAAASHAQSVDPCQKQFRITANISAAATAKIITGVAGTQTYICSFDIVNGTPAQNVALVEGTGATCGTATAGMAGGTTAATGWNLGANQTFVKGNGEAWVYATAVKGDNVCLLFSGTTQLSGSVQYVQM